MCCQYAPLRTDQLLGGFKKELDGRYKSLQDARVELERLYGKRVDDSKIDLPEFQQLKEECLAGIRQAEGAVTSYHGSVRSIKAVVETRMHIIVWVALSLWA